MLEQDIQLNKRLKLIIDEIQFDDNYSEIIPLIDQDKHPFLHRYLSMKAKQY